MWDNLAVSSEASIMYENDADDVVAMCVDDKSRRMIFRTPQGDVDAVSVREGEFVTLPAKETVMLSSGAFVRIRPVHDRFIITKWFYR